MDAVTEDFFVVLNELVDTYGGEPDIIEAIHYAGCSINQAWGHDVANQIKHDLCVKVLKAVKKNGEEDMEWSEHPSTVDQIVRLHVASVVINILDELEWTSEHDHFTGKDNDFARTSEQVAALRKIQGAIDTTVALLRQLTLPTEQGASGGEKGKRRRGGCSKPWMLLETYTVASKWFKEDLNQDENKRKPPGHRRTISHKEREADHARWIVSQQGDPNKWWRSWDAMEQHVSTKAKQGGWTLSRLRAASAANPSDKFYNTYITGVTAETEAIEESIEMSETESELWD